MTDADLGVARTSVVRDIRASGVVVRDPRFSLHGHPVDGVDELRCRQTPEAN